MTLDEENALASSLREQRTTTQAEIDEIAEQRRPALLRYQTHTGPSASTGAAH